VVRVYRGHELPPTAHPDCGTYAAVNRHGKDNEALDPACAAYAVAYARRWRVRRGKTTSVRVSVELVRQAVGDTTGDLRAALLAVLGETPETWSQWLREEAVIRHALAYEGMGNYRCQACGTPTGGWPCPNGPDALPMDPVTHMPVDTGRHDDAGA
jgi:hypothetical protein